MLLSSISNGASLHCKNKVGVRSRVHDPLGACVITKEDKPSFVCI